MSRRLRLITALAVSQVVAAAILLALRGLHLSTTPLVASNAGLASVPIAVLWLCVVFLALAWGYLLAGAAHAHPVVRVAALGVYGASLVPISQDVGWHGAPAVIRILALAALAGATLLSARGRSGAQAPDTALGVLRLLVFIGLSGAVYATYAWDAAADTVFRQFTFGFADGLMSMSFGLIPVLYLTGAEFSGWAEVIGERAATATQRIGSNVLLGALAGVISVAVLVHDVSSYGSQLPAQIVLFTLGAALIMVLARRVSPRGGWPHALPWPALALTACVFIGVLLTEVYRTTNLPPEHPSRASGAIAGELRSYQHPGRPAFSLRIPENWEVLPLEVGDPTRLPTLTGFSGRSTANKADLFVTTAPNRLLPGAAPLLPIFLHHFYASLRPRLGTVHVERGWRVTPFSLGAHLRGIAWERRIGSLRWVLAGYSSRGVFGLDGQLFAAMWQSFSTHLPAGVPASAPPHGARDPYGYNPVVVVPFLVWLLVSIMAAALLVVLRERWSAARQVSLVFVCAFGLLYALSQLRQVLEELAHGSVGPIYSVRLPGIQAAVAILTLGAVLRIGFRRERLGAAGSTLRTLVMLGGGLQLLLWIAQLYQAGSRVGARLSVAQGIIILLALLWELAVSGESITNGHSVVLPRASRVLAFCGYIMLVATAVLFFSALRLQATGASIEPQFESEGWPALGILQLGVPALLCLAALQLRLWERRGTDSRSHRA